MPFNTLLLADPVDITTILGTAFTAIQSNVMGTIAVALPIALGIAGIFIAVKLGIKFFKSSTH